MKLRRQYPFGQYRRDVPNSTRKGAEERLELRQLRSRPVLDKLQRYLLQIQTEVLPKSPEPCCALCSQELEGADSLLPRWES